MSAGREEDALANFARATALMDEARQRLDQLSAADVEVQSVVAEARRVNSGLLQVLSVLMSSADQSLANQKALAALTDSMASPANASTLR